MVKVVYANEKYFKSFHEALSQVAAERVYLEMIQPPPLESVAAYQQGLIQRKGPTYYAVDGETVVGWADIFPEDNPRQSHRGSLGMGIISEYRGQGLGMKLLKAATDKAREMGLEKVELNVYTTNTNAIKLYKKFGFKEEGLIKKYRKLDGQYFDSLVMAFELI
ncbi:MAG: GNAT family N-acetyltransferase [Pseudobdellovibrio sp.]